eukprot:4464251-Alexandrium_andersonii.AAC.1
MVSPTVVISLPWSLPQWLVSAENDRLGHALPVLALRWAPPWRMNAFSLSVGRLSVHSFK